MNLNGKKFDQGKTEWDLLPLGPVEEIVKVLMHGREKYGRDNWQLVDNPIRRYYAAAQRHLAAFRRARFDTKNPFDAVDSESKLHHLAHAACCLLFLLWHERKELCEEDAAGVLNENNNPVSLPDMRKGTKYGVWTQTQVKALDDLLRLDRLMEDLVAGKEKLQDELDTLRRQIDNGLGEPILVREITDEIKFATYDPDALDKLTARDVQEIESKAFGAVDKGKDSFKVKGIKFWRVV